MSSAMKLEQPRPEPNEESNRHPEIPKSAPGGRHHVVIIGGGFGGLAAAQGLADAEHVDVTLIDKRNFHLFQPLLYQVATGALSPGDVAAPLREILRKAHNITVLLGDVTDIDVGTRTVKLDDALCTAAGQDNCIRYDTLVVAAGSVSNYFGHDDWERWAPGLKSVEDATELRSRLLLAFEEAERTSDPAQRRSLLTFVIVGGGPTGVELAGAIWEIATETIPKEFQRIAMERVRVILVDAGPRVLATFHAKLSDAALRDLKQMGIDVRTRTMVRDLDAGGVIVETSGADGSPVRERIDANLIIWAAGVCAAALTSRVADLTGAKKTRQGNVEVQPDLTIAGHPDILVIGDAASLAGADGKPLPGVAQVAIQQGDYAASLVISRIAGKDVKPFEYHDRGSMATIGRAKAVADLRFTQISGFFAWLVWLFIHLMWLVGFENRVLVLAQWAWYYIWRRRSARLITAWHAGEKPPTSLLS